MIAIRRRLQPRREREGERVAEREKAGREQSRKGPGSIAHGAIARFACEGGSRADDQGDGHDHGEPSPWRPSLGFEDLRDRVTDQ